jgi:hypothetical protein
MIPRVTRDQVLAALAHYDETIRETEEGSAWEGNQAHKWCLLHDGRRYPIKQVVALAAGVEPATFTGGGALNTRVAKLGFTVAPLERSAAPAEPKVEDDTAATIAQLRQQVEALQLVLETAAARQALLCAALCSVRALVPHASGCPIDPCSCAALEPMLQAHEALALVLSSAPERKAVRP